MFPSYLPVKAPDPGAYHFNFLGHNQKCLTYKKSIPDSGILSCVVDLEFSIYFHTGFCTVSATCACQVFNAYTNSSNTSKAPSPLR